MGNGASAQGNHIGGEGLVLLQSALHQVALAAELAADVEVERLEETRILQRGERGKVLEIDGDGNAHLKSPSDSQWVFKTNRGRGIRTPSSQVKPVSFLFVSR